MEVRNTKKYIWIFLLCCLPLSNILWYAAYSSGDESVAASLVILTSFLPALTALILCKISREGWDNLMILPNIRKAWRAYLFASNRCAGHELLKRAAHVSYVQGRGIFSGRSIYPAWIGRDFWNDNIGRFGFG